MILSNLSVSIQPIMLWGVQLTVKVRFFLVISGSKQRAVSWIYCMTSPLATFSFSSPACDLLVSSICCNRRTIRWIFICIMS